jgi:hypothetical protein
MHTDGPPSYIYVCCACEPHALLDDAAPLVKMPCKRHGIWQHRQMVKAADGSLQLANPRILQSQTGPDSDTRVRKLLQDDLEAAKRKMIKAAEVFNETMRQIPSGLPAPDGRQRIHNASRDYSSAREKHIKALTRLNRFILNGVVPEDLERPD